MRTDLTLEDVYDSLGKDTFYCPQCHHKTLRRGSRSYYTVYACTYNMKPRTYRGDEPKGKPCDLVIAHDDRDAKIEDYGGVLGQMAEINTPMIQKYLLKNDPNIHARGFQVIYEGELCDVVRHRHNDDGVCVALYWRARTWDSDNRDIANPTQGNYDHCRTESANHVEFRGFPCSKLFARGDKVVLWKKDKETQVFKGRYGKRMKREIAEFAKAFEQSIEQLSETCHSEAYRWQREEREFRAAVHCSVMDDHDRLHILHYSGLNQTASIRINHVTPEEAIKLRDRFKIEDLTFMGLYNTNRTSITPEEALKVQEVLGCQYSVDINSRLWKVNGGRFYLDEVKYIAAVLHPRG